MHQKLNSIFKAYDVRGLYPQEIDEETISRIGEAYAEVKKPKKVTVGRDVRNSGESLKKELISSLLNRGIDVVDIGTITTDQLYFAVGNYKLDGGISVTASHNPGEYNGLKFSESGGAPIGSNTLQAMRDWAASDAQAPEAEKGKLETLDISKDYVEHVISYVDSSKIKPLKILANANFGAVGRAVDKIAGKLNLKLERFNWQEDGSFPKGPPNPLLAENRDETIESIKKLRPDLGVAWDADADRVFFFTGSGTFVPSCFIISLLAKELLGKYPGSKIIHDVTTSWVIDNTITKAGGLPITNRTGHTFMKARMRQEDAVFAGESSGHYYFKDSFYADNGIVPLLLIIEMMSKSGKTLEQLVAPLMSEYKVSGEINFKVSDPRKSLGIIEAELGKEGNIDKTDGLVVETGEWRFSARPSNTEPLFRLNAEAKNQTELDGIVKKVTALITED